MAKSESQAAVAGLAAGTVFEVEDYTFDVEQTLNIGSQSTGSGAGKISFNPFTITRRIDKFSPTLFAMACSGTPFAFVKLYLVKSAGAKTPPFLTYTFKLVAVKAIQYDSTSDTLTETVSFEYGGLLQSYIPQVSSGAFGTTVTTGWNRVRNIQDTSTTTLIK